jgi:hypothetical protein
MLSDWNKFVSKIYKEGKSKNSNYKFKDALKDASARKGEMGKTETESVAIRPYKSKRNSKSMKRTSMKQSKTQKMRGKRHSRTRRGGKHPLMHAQYT